MRTKQRIDELEEKIDELFENGKSLYWTVPIPKVPIIWRVMREFGSFRNDMLDKVAKLEWENRKLKAIVAELCNYVYSDEPSEGEK